MQYGDYQLEIYGAGLQGVLPRWPVDFAGLEAAAGASLPDWILNYVAGGAGDERTQRGNAEAFGWWGIVPRMMNGAYERDLTTTICGVDLPTPLFCCPIGVIGLCSQDFHGDLAVARACARTGVPMVMSTLSQDPLEDVAAALGNTPGFFQLYTPKDRDVAVSLIQRAEKAGFRGARRHPGHLGDRLAPARPQHRQLPPAARALPGQLLLRPGVPRAARRPAGGEPARRDRDVGEPVREQRLLGRPDLDARGHRHADPAQGDQPPRRRPPRGGPRRGRAVLLQPRRPAGQRRASGAGDAAGRRRGGRRRAGAVRLGRALGRRRREGAGARGLGGGAGPARTRTHWRSAARTAWCTTCARCSPRPT